MVAAASFEMQVIEATVWEVYTTYVGIITRSKDHTVTTRIFASDPDFGGTESAFVRYGAEDEVMSEGAAREGDEDFEYVRAAHIQ
jgi:hypothetical protein